MRVKQYDVDGFGEPFVTVNLNQDDIDMIFYALSDRRNKFMKQDRHDKVNEIQGIIDMILDIDNELFRIINERE